MPEEMNYQKLLESINQKLAHINQEGYDYYEQADLDRIHEEMQEKIKEAKKIYDEKLNPKRKPETWEKILSSALKKKMEDNKFDGLLKAYSESEYTLRSAFDEIFNKASATRPEALLTSYLGKDTNIRIIQFCKNVRTIEDLLDRICSNNIDKSIVKGERHVESMKNGFKWLFSQSSPTFEMDKEINAYRSIDIRDEKRFFDFLKYQIVASSRDYDEVPSAPDKLEEYTSNIEKRFTGSNYKKKRNYIEPFKKTVSGLIDEFFTVYALLSEYRDLVFKEEEIKGRLRENQEACETGEKKNESKWLPSAQIVILSAVALRVLTDRFVSFVKINDLNFGNSTFNRSWFNYSELSDGNYAGSSFQHVRIENAIVRRCDLSTSDFSDADLSGTDFTGSNFNYSNLTGTNFNDAVLNDCQLQSAIFRDINLDRYQDALTKIFEKINNKYPIGLFDEWKKTKAEDNIIRKKVEEISEAYQNKFAEPTIQSLIIGESLNTLKTKDEWSDASATNIYNKIKRLLKSVLRSAIPKAILRITNSVISSTDANGEADTEKEEREGTNGRVRLSKADFKKASVKRCQLSGTDLSHLDISNASFENSDLSNAMIYYASSFGTSFMKTNLIGTECFESDFSFATFDGCAASNAVFINCDLKTTNWNKAILIGSTFLDATHSMEDIIRDNDSKPYPYIYLSHYFDAENGAKISNLLSDCIVPEYPDVRAYSNMDDDFVSEDWQKDCSLNDSKMESALLDNSNFINMRADKSSFKDSSMKNAILANCSMHLTDFINTDLRYAVIVLSSLGDDNFTHANITMAIIQHSEFCNASFTDALLNSANLDHVLFYGANLEKLNVTKATFRNCAFIDCNISKMILQNATFESCVFEHLDFTDLVAKRTAKFTNCIASQCRDDDTEQSLKHHEGLEWPNNYD